eukprot:138768-Prorocentrum_minimum.AAC.2
MTSCEITRERVSVSQGHFDEVKCEGELTSSASLRALVTHFLVYQVFCDWVCDSYTPLSRQASAVSQSSKCVVSQARLLSVSYAFGDISR